MSKAKEKEKAKAKEKERANQKREYHESPLAHMLDARRWIMKHSSSEQCTELWKSLSLEIQRNMITDFVTYRDNGSLTEQALKMKNMISNKPKLDHHTKK
jgi:hypothetical protein